MIDREAIRDFCQELVEAFHPQKVVLFGSYAYGTPDDGSDVDLLVVMPISEAPARVSAEILMALAPSFPVDVLVRSPEQLALRLKAGDEFLREIMQKGIMLHDVA